MKKTVITVTLAALCTWAGSQTSLAQGNVILAFREWPKPNMPEWIPEEPGLSMDLP
jgi:hypothetical protein